ncbi:MAG: hypothetical protein A4S09_07620 [Proteobacteria bacterium SG_bin7]|nr:MAG: hypothetical protein A4S09_07620 [Proteobacteria bacterium SG_bin7]
MEFEIQKGLRAGQSCESIGQSLVQSSIMGKTNQGTVNAIGFFLSQTGQYPLLFDFVSQLAKEKKPIPWGATTMALAYLSEKIPTSYMDLIMEGANEQDELAQILPLKNLEGFSDKFLLERKKYLTHLREEYDKHKKSILDKISYFKSQRMIDEESKAIAEFAVVFPSSDEIKDLREDFERRKAEHLIASMNEQAEKKTPLRRPRPQPVPVEIQQWVTALVKVCQQKAKNDPQSAIDLAMMFYFFELYNEALAVISMAPPSHAVNWLRLELKVLAGRYVEAMEEARNLEQLYATDPESTFAATYARAQCLWELGQNSLAISLLQGIVSIRPYFRSAYSLLKQWTEENP